MRAADVETASFPDDPAALRALLVAALSRCDVLEAERNGVAVERDALAARNERLQHLLQKLRRMQFGSKRPVMAAPTYVVVGQAWMIGGGVQYQGRSSATRPTG